MAMVALEMSEGTASGSITLTMICRGEAPMLCAVSMMLGLISRRLPSTRRAMKGKAAMTSGTMVAGVPTTVPTIRRVRGKTMIIRIRKGTERSRLIITFRTCSSQRGTRRIFPSSPATSSTPSGRPIRIAKKVERMVT